MKKYLSLFLVLVMLISSMPLNVFAEGEDAQSDEGSVSVAAAAEESAEDTKQDTKEEPKQDEPKQEEPAKEEPKQEEPAKEEPKQEEPAQEQPTEEQPTEEQPAEQQPTEEQPAEQQPAEQQPTDEQPTDEQPAEGEQEVTDPSLPADGLMENVPGLPGGGMIEFSAEYSIIDRFTLKEKTSESVTLTWRETVSPSASVADGGFVIDYGYGETPFASSTMRTVKVDAGETSCTITGLEIGRSYYFRISGRYSNESGEYFPGTPVELNAPVLICPYEPKDLWVDPYSASAVNLEWAAPEDTSHVTGYMIQWIDANGSESTPKYQQGADKTTYRPTNLKVGQTYTFRVYTYYTPVKTTKKILSEKYAENVFTVKLARPTKLDAAATSLSEIKLTWNNVSGATGFQIWRRRGSTGAYEQVGDIQATDKPKFVDQNDIRAGFTYIYYVVAYCTTGATNELGAPEIVCSDKSGEVAVTVFPPAPTGVKAVYKSDTEIEIKWNAVQDAEGYVLEGSDDGETFTPIELPNQLATYYIEDELDVGQIRYYRLKSYVVLAGNKALSENYSTVVYDTTRPLAPENLELCNPASYNQIMLTWDPSSGADGYEILRGTSSSTAPTWVAKDIDDPSILEWTDTGLTFNKVYYYRVRAYVYDTNGVKRVGPTTETKAFRAKPAATTIQSAAQVPETATATVEWDRVDGATGYYVYIRQNGGEYKLLSTVPGQQDQPVQQKTLNGLSLNTEYEIAIAAYRTVNGTKVAGDRSEPFPLSMEFYEPLDLAFTPVNQTSVKLTWKRMYGITGYEVFLECVNDPTQNETRLITSNSMTLTGLDSRNNYKASVRPYIKTDAYAYGDYCDPVDFYTAPVASAKLVVRAGSVEGQPVVNVYWRAVADCDGYIVERSTTKDSGYSVIMEPREGADNLSYVDKDALDIGTKYYYRVRAFSRSGVSTAPYGYVHAGAPITNSLILPPAQVQNLEAEVTGAKQVTLTWDEVDNAEGYYVYRKKKGGDYQRIGTVPFGTTTFESNWLLTGTEYTYYVCAYTGTVYGAKSTEVKARPAPLAPLSVDIVDVNARSVKLSWDSPTGATSYKVYAQLADGASKYMMTVNSKKATVTTTVKNLQYNTPYKFTVRACANGATGPESDPSMEVCTKMADVTGFTKVQTYYSTSAVKLDWAWIPDVTGYEVQKSTDGGSTWTAAAKPTASDCVVSGLSLRTPYSFRVRPYLVIDGTTHVGEWEEISDCYVVPGAVSGLRFRASSKSVIRMTWNGMANVDGYEVTYWVKGHWTETKTLRLEGSLGTGTITARLEGLDSNTTYAYYVRPIVQIAPGTYVYGKQSATLTSKTAK